MNKSRFVSTEQRLSVVGGRLVEAYAEIESLESQHTANQERIKELQRKLDTNEIKEANEEEDRLGSCNCAPGYSCGPCRFANRTQRS